MMATFRLTMFCPVVPPTVMLKTTYRLKIDATKAASSGPQPRRLRRRRRLCREDPKLISKDEPFPFLERQERSIREDGKEIAMHVEQLTLQCENKFALVREIAEEANAYLLSNPEEAIFKKPVLRAISTRINEAAGRTVVADAYTDAVELPIEEMGEFNLH